MRVPAARAPLVVAALLAIVPDFTFTSERANEARTGPQEFAPATLLSREAPRWRSLIREPRLTPG